MSIISKSVMLLWFDIQEIARESFYEWHSKEHLPDRMKILGFKRARRFKSIYGELGFLCLYEIESKNVLHSDKYIKKCQTKPSKLEVMVESNFNDIAREVCDVKKSYGNTDGGLFATFRYAVSQGSLDAHTQEMSEIFLPKLLSESGVAGCHFLITDEFNYIDNAINESKLEIRCTLLVESWGGVEKFKILCNNLSVNSIFEVASNKPILGCYRLQNSLVTMEQ